METQTTWSLQVTARVRSVIKDAGLNEAYVAEQTGIANSTFSRKMNPSFPHYPLTLLDLENIAAVLGVSPETFLPFQSARRAS